MPIPADMQPVPMIIEKRYVTLIDQVAQTQRVSRSRAVRDLVIEALGRRFSLPDGFLEEPKELEKSTPTTDLTTA